MPSRLSTKSLRKDLRVAPRPASPTLASDPPPLSPPWPQGGPPLRSPTPHTAPLIPIAHCYEGGLAWLELSGATRREQAVAAAAAADGGAAVKAHLAASAKAMVIEAFLPGADDAQHSVMCTQVVPVNFTISSSDEKLLSSLAEAIFSCVAEDAKKDYLGGTSSLFQKQQLNYSIDSSVCINRLSETEVIRNAKRCLESFNLTKSSHKLRKVKNRWWSTPNYESLEKIGGS